MRLIDRDKFISDMFDLYIEQKWKPSDIHFSLLDVRNNIDFKGYEVKAIPIETIKKEIERLKEDIKWAWYYGNTALDKMEYLKMWLEIKLEDWEKENGADK